LTWDVDRTAIIWNATSCSALRTLVFDVDVECASVTHQERVVTCSEGGECALWDTSRFEQIGVPTVRGVWGLELFPSGTRVLSWGRVPVAWVWDGTTGEVTCELRGHAAAIDVGRVFPDEERVLTGSRDGKAIIWDLRSCAPLHVYRHSDWVIDAVVLAGGRSIAALSLPEGLVVWSGDLGERWRMRVASRPEEPGDLSALAAFPAGDRLILWGLRAPAVLIVDAATGALLHRLAHSSSFLYEAVVAPAGDIVVACGSGGVTVWDAMSGAQLHQLPLSCSSIDLAVGSAVDPRGWRDLA